MEEKRDDQPICERCKQPKARRRGRFCKACGVVAYREENRDKLAARAREHYARNPEPSKLRSKLWLQKNPDIRREAHLKSYYKHPNKTQAQVAVFRAVKNGTLDKLSCAICGAPETEAHHFSYEKEHWLHVIWLCPQHHGEAHRGLWPQIKIPEEV